MGGMWRIGKEGLISSAFLGGWEQSKLRALASVAQWRGTVLLTVAAPADGGLSGPAVVWNG